MKKYFASPKISFVLIFQSLFDLALLELMILVLCKSEVLTMILAAPFILIVDFYISFQKYRNAFVIFGVDESGLHTKYTSIKWEEILSYELMVPDAYRSLKKSSWTKIKCPSIVCIGNYDSNKSFFAQNKNQCVFFSLTKKQLSLIEKYGKGKSTAIDQLLNYYMDIVDE